MSSAMMRDFLCTQFIRTSKLLGFKVPFFIIAIPRLYRYQFTERPGTSTLKVPTFSVRADISVINIILSSKSIGNHEFGGKIEGCFKIVNACNFTQQKRPRWRNSKAFLHLKVIRLLAIRYGERHKYRILLRDNKFSLTNDIRTTSIFNRSIVVTT